MKTSLCLLISIATILILIRRFHVSVAVIVGAFVLGILTLGLDCFNVMFSTVTSFQTLKFLIIITLAFTLAYSMKESGALDMITQSSLSLFGKASTFVIPAMIGLLPMPGGAIVSAVMLRDIVKSFKISPEKATFLNYWFRHVWACLDPIYPSVIITLAILEISYLTLLKSTYLITLAMIAFGLPFVSLERSNNPKDLRGFLYLTPILIVVVLTVLGVDLAVSLTVAVSLLYIFRKPSLREVAKKAINLKIYLLIVALLYYKDLIIKTGSSHELFEDLTSLGIPQPITATILSFVLGFVTGIESGYAALAIPLLTPFTGIGEKLVAKNLMLVVGAGILGVMFSPLHLCLILTREYYSANLEKVYTRYLIPAGLLTLLSLFLAYLML
jgi:integral membrane protein (TIGR00529 family)